MTTKPTNVIDIGEVYHMDLGDQNHPDLSQYAIPMRIKGKRVGILFSQHINVFERVGIKEVDLRMLGEYHPDCYVANDLLFYGKELKGYLDMWLKSGDAYKEHGFYHFVTQLGEEPTETK